MSGSKTPTRTMRTGIDTRCKRISVAVSRPRRTKRCEPNSRVANASATLRAEDAYACQPKGHCSFAYLERHCESAGA